MRLPDYRWILMLLGLGLAASIALADEGDIRIDAKDDNTVRAAFELAMLLQNGEKVHALPASKENDAACQTNLGIDYRAFGFAIDAGGRPHILCTKAVWDHTMAEYLCRTLNSEVGSFDEPNQVLVCRRKPNA